MSSGIWSRKMIHHRLDEASSLDCAGTSIAFLPEEFEENIVGGVGGRQYIQQSHAGVIDMV